MGRDEDSLTQHWMLVAKDWYSIYQWEPLTRPGYTEFIAAWIDSALPAIALEIEGLRSRSFRLPGHRGQIKLQTNIEQMTEKRFVRAMFNQSSVPPLGTVLDYEVPLKETERAQHGDIDLLCVHHSLALLIEAKKPPHIRQRDGKRMSGSTESLLKGVLQAFTYTSLVGTCRLRFLKDFGLSQDVVLAPAVLTFAGTPSARQLKHPDAWPNLFRLIRSLNAKLALAGIAPMKAFVVDNDEGELAQSVTVAQQANGDTKAVFRQGFVLRISECSMP